MVSFAFGGATHAGRVRRSNQDRFLATGTTFAVADGLGGHAGGEVASAIAVEVLAGSEPVASVRDLIRLTLKANKAIGDEADRTPGLHGMGTTISILAELSGTDPHRLGVANVGDSRIYRLVGRSLRRCSIDHSQVEEWVRSGELSPAEAAVHPQRNMVTRALGIDPVVAVDAWELRPVAGDRYLLCSDGLFGEVAEDEIAAVLDATDDPAVAADRLVLAACDNGGSDNVTAVVVDITCAAPVKDPPADRILAEHLDVIIDI